MSLFDVTVNNNVRGFAEDQYVELTRKMIQLSEENRQIKQLIKSLGEIMSTVASKDDVTRVVQEGVDAALVEAAKLIVKEKAEVVAKLDELIAKFPSGGVTLEDLAGVKNQIVGGITAGLGPQIDDISTASPTGAPNPNPPSGGGDGTL